MIFLKLALYTQRSTGLILRTFVCQNVPFTRPYSRQFELVGNKFKELFV
jgi:hypothetical protein